MCQIEINLCIMTLIDPTISSEVTAGEILGIQSAVLFRRIEPSKAGREIAIALRYCETVSRLSSTRGGFSFA